MPQRLVSSVLNYLKIVEKLKFFDIVISLKASNTLDTIEAYRKMAKLCDYPFHLGLTATGLPSQGAIKSSIALGTLLLEGIGDTLRISLTDNPEEEIKAAKSILESLGIRRFNPEIISCPTCGRCEVDLIKLVRELENKLSAINCKLLTVNSRPIRVALMGCVVNGPGEAKDADVGIAFGQSGGVLFKKGKPIRRIPFKNCLEILRKEMGEKYD
jgi:(E)-4-hydroxy-3-methylbut-2-enyl-diphosphate synthase